MSLTSDPDDPRLGHGVDNEPVPQNEAYLVLSEEERAKGFVRPVRTAYRHVGQPGPAGLTRPLTDEELLRWPTQFVCFETYPPERAPAVGRFWSQEQLDAVGRGCGAVTSMALALGETYARDPGFYGATYCTHCAKHLPVIEFIWLDGERVGS